ncbi:hypothetical protein G7046_g370 [Stylonectria norvegica]|nr:hypothetical protein G7046_g370 [Stylonectria norvegica]
MPADFWAGYLSGAVGIIIGNPLDVIKVRLQAQHASSAATMAATTAGATSNVNISTYARHFGSSANLITGTAAPIFGYGALNALLFVSYNRTEAALNNALSIPGSLWTTWLAGAVGGLSTWVLAIVRQIWRSEGIRGLYFGGAVTAVRDSVGYGFYFWSYQLSTQWLATEPGEEASLQHEAAKVMLCGGLAGIVTWASIFPLDVIKTRVQTQPWEPRAETSPLLQSQQSSSSKRAGAIFMSRQAYREGGAAVFFRGLAVCSVRAFIVNAVQWAVYEWIMHEMGQGRKQTASGSELGEAIA